MQTLTGVYLDKGKTYLLEHRLSDLMRDYHLESFDEVIHKLETQNDIHFRNKIIDSITTHETKFFREVSLFDALIAQILPEWLSRSGSSQPADKKISIWSAGCSTGQEPYSAAIMIKEHLPTLLPHTSILATDISTLAIERAQKGEYTEFEIDRGMPPHLRDRYFKKGQETYVLDPAIRSLVTFSQHNLLKDSYPGPFDIIFCRNVAIYFDDNDKKKVHENIKKALKPDGVMVLGSAEFMNGFVNGYIIREFGLARYYEFSSKVTLF